MCNNETLPVFCSGIVEEIQKKSQSVFSLKVKGVFDNEKNYPLPGQFYLIQKEGFFLGRPISLYKFHKEKCILEFLVLIKGRGTEALSRLKGNDRLEILGPLGNSFPLPDTGRVALVGGGIGVAPVAGFASVLSEGSYDFFASFRGKPFGLDYIFRGFSGENSQENLPENLFISTEDGSTGIKGILPAIFNKKTLEEKQYSAVYACGPEPMLRYVRDLCREAGVQSYLSLEKRMACGMGACLGCRVLTTHGNKRCCKEGPVFKGEEVIFEDSKPVNPVFVSGGRTPNAGALKTDLGEPDLSVDIAGVEFKNPVIAASGTFGYGKEYSPLMDVSGLGGICSKGLTLNPSLGNNGIRIWESPSGLLNSIGLENPGVEHFIKYELEEMKQLGPVVIANLSSPSLEDYKKGASLLDKSSVDMIELNISCPNVKKGGMAFGLEPESAYEVCLAVRNETSKPLIVKLSPNAPELCLIADAAVKAGADGLSLVNTFKGMAVDIERGIPVFDNITAGFSGPAIKPVALRMVYEVSSFLKKNGITVPVIGMGGISTWEDAVEFIMAGASAVQVGSATFSRPDSMTRIIEGLKAFLKRKGIPGVREITGIIGL